MNFLKSLHPFLPKLRNFFLITGIISLILGFRIFIGIRFVAAIPQVDDWPTLLWLQNWSQGIHDWHFIWVRHNGHPFVLYYLMNLGQYLLNGYWDGRLDFLAFAFMHTAYAAVVIFTFQNVLTPRDRTWLLALIFFLFAVPFAGYRIGWGNVWPHSAMMLFSLWALYRTAYHGEKWTDVIFISLVAFLAALNMASGCLGALMVASLILFRAAVTRRLTSRNAVLCLLCLAIFLACYLAGQKLGRAGLLEGLDATLKALAWPDVFIPGAGIFTVIPLLGIVAAYIALPSFRQRNTEYAIAASGLLFLVAIATGAFRGENNNMGMPSGRYYDVFILVPLVCAVALCLLYRGTAGRSKQAWAVFSYVWLCVQVFAFSVHFFYRTIPFLAQESGEWSEPHKQVLFRDLIRGTTTPPPTDHLQDETIDFPSYQTFDVISGKMPMPAMTLPMLTGFPLQPGSQGNYLPEGYHPSYHPRPMQLYWGSYDRQKPYADDKWFLSGPFHPQADYITIDILVDKRSRLTNYHLDGLTLTLRDETTGQRTELLPLLARAYPFVFRDWELIYVKVIPGHDYRIESTDTSPSQWIAFGEPFEGGRLTPFTVGVGQSGKLLCFIGLFFLTLVLGLDHLDKLRRPA